MNKILTIDSGTAKSGMCLTENGRYISSKTLSYSDAVKKDKNGYYTSVEKRRISRQARHHYKYLRYRSAALLKLLNDNNMCPFISKTDIRLWTHEKYAPVQLIEDWTKGHSPYDERVTLLNSQLDMSAQDNRYMFGRAMYSLSHNRGFKFAKNILDGDSKKSSTSEGEIKKSANMLAKEMANVNCKYVSEYFQLLINSGQRVRAQYHSDRNQIEAEFNRICDVQQIEDSLRKKLYEIIFGPGKRKFPESKRKNCPYEKNHKVCFDSHPAFEEYRMWQTIMHIRVGADKRVPTSDEIASLIPVFYKFKGNFKCSHLRKAINAEVINFSDDQTIAGCPFSRSIASLLFPDDKTKWLNWKTEAATRLSVSLGRNIKPDDAADIIWNECYLAERNDTDSTLFFSHKLGISNYSKDDIILTTETASLSKQACLKITHFMRDYSLTNSSAVRMVMIPTIIRNHTNGNVALEIQKARIDTIAECLKSYSYQQHGYMNEYLYTCLNKLALDSPVTKKELNKILWDHNTIDKYEPIVKNGIKLLPMPSEGMISLSLWRTFCIYRREINRMLIDGIIDEYDRVIIESERQDLTINQKKATAIINKEIESHRAEMVQKIQRLTKSKTVPSDDQIELYALWEEQNHIDLWTGEEILERDIFSGQYNTEHTVAITCGGHNTRDNKTISDAHFNQKVKKSTLPGLMFNIEEVMERVQQLYSPLIESLTKDIEKNKNAAKFQTDPEKHSRLVVDRLVMEDKLAYYKKKLASFSVTQNIDSYSDGQGTTNNYIIKQLAKWLKSVFRHVEYSRASMMSGARRSWGIAKNRDYNSNHAEDAFIHATIAYYGSSENVPYPEFRDDLNRLRSGSRTVTTLDNLPSKKLRSKRGSGYGKKLHEDTQHGVICDPDSKEFVAVHRVSIDNIGTKIDPKNIVNSTLRESVTKALQDGTVPLDYQGNPIRHIRVYSLASKDNKKSIDKLFVCPAKNSYSKHSYKNNRYYYTNGYAYARYYDDHTIQLVSVIDDSKGQDVKQKDESKANFLFNIREGDTVAVYTDWETPDIFKKMPKKELNKRLFVIKQIEVDGRMKLYHHDYNPSSKPTSQDNYNDVGTGTVKFIRKGKIPFIKVNRDILNRF